MLRRLIELKDEVVEDRYTSTSTKLFEGAGLVISEADEAEAMGDFIHVKTPYAQDLSALIYRLKDIYKAQLDYLNKYAFYGRLGEVAKRAVQNSSNRKTILLDVVDEAIRFAGEAVTIIYFAYGSNMDESQMMERCPGARALGVGQLHGFQFALDSEGTATLIDSSEDSVWGVAWEISGNNMVNLDRHEGIKALCYRHSFIQVMHEDHEVAALVYISNRDPNRGFLRKGYLEKIIKAASRWQFPTDYFEFLDKLLSMNTKLPKMNI